MAAHEEDARHVSQLLIEQVSYVKCSIPWSFSRSNLPTLYSSTNVSMRWILRHAFWSLLSPTLISLKSLTPSGTNLISHTPKGSCCRFTVAWANEVEGFKTELINPHTSETEEYGINSVVFRSRIPFHPTRVMAFFFGSGEVTNYKRIAEESPLKCVYRSKGTGEVANRKRGMGQYLGRPWAKDCPHWKQREVARGTAKSGGLSSDWRRARVQWRAMDWIGSKGTIEFWWRGQVWISYLLCSLVLQRSHDYCRIKAMVCFSARYVQNRSWWHWLLLNAILAIDLRKCQLFETSEFLVTCAALIDREWL